MEEVFQPSDFKRRSSILKPPEKRNRDSRTVSFSEKYLYKELHQDGTSEITNLFMGQDMDISEMAVIEPDLGPHDRTIEASVDMSLDQITTPRRISEDDTFTVEMSLDDTFFGAFHDSNDLTNSTEPGSLIHNIEALDACVQQFEANQRELDDEIEDLLKFYRHIVNKDNKYEFAIKIFGLRYGLWLIIKINPEIYPDEKLNLKFAVNKKDKHLYPFPAFARAVKHFTHEGKVGYLTRFVINAQKFRRFLNNDKRQAK